MKRTFFASFAMAFAVFAGTAPAESSSTTSPAAAEEPAVASEAPVAEAPAAAEGMLTFEQPLLVTDVGQGNSAKLIEVMLNRAKDVEFTANELAKAEELEGVKTLVIGVGASTKGLGAAGLDQTTEMERTRALISAAKEADIEIIGVHIGGVPRRGELSDGFNAFVLESSDLFIAWKGGDEDGFFTRLAGEHKVPLILPERKPEVGQVLIDALHNGFDKSTAAAGVAAAN